MYQPDQAHVLRRGLWILLWLVVIVVALWALVWLLFFHHPTPSATLHESNSKQTHSASNSPSSQSANGGAATTKNDGQSPGSTVPDTNTSKVAPNSNQLANAGAGNVFVPFGVATLAGTAFYYVRLRRKAMQ